MGQGLLAQQSRWRGPGVAFALSLALHVALLGAGLWLLGAREGVQRGATALAVTLAPAPAAASAPLPRDVAAPVPAPSEPPAREPMPPTPAALKAPATGAAPPANVLTASAESEAEAERRRRERMAARGSSGIAVPSHSQAAPAAAPAPEVAAAAPGADAATQRGFVELHVLDWLAQHRQYPRAARRAGLEGTVHVRFVIDPEGRIAGAAVERSSGARVLDRAALDLLGRASPVPGLTQFGLAQALELRLPIDFRLRRAAPAG